MCGITAYVGQQDTQEILLAGLERLEYRGYDSAGIALAYSGGVETVRAVGNLAALRQAVALASSSVPVLVGAGASSAAPADSASAGIGHTRWATHGRVEERNAHPHTDRNCSVYVVLNGIVENYLHLKQQLSASGDSFSSETDAEVVAHLISQHYEGDLAAAVRAAYAQLKGHYAFVAIHQDQPGLLVAARHQCPLVIGRGEEEQYLASDIPAFLSYTRQVQYLEDGDIAVLRQSGVEITDPQGRPVTRPVSQVDWDAETAEKAGYESFMLKEMHEQPKALTDTLADRLSPDGYVHLPELTALLPQLTRARRILIVACGTSYHAGLIGRYAIERWARVPVEIDVASEFRYRDPILSSEDVVIGITQSGETADTLAAMKLARQAGATVVAVTNIMGSAVTRESDATLYTRAGLEVGVAATKTFLAQVAAMYLLALKMARLRSGMRLADVRELGHQLREIPMLVESTLSMNDLPAKRLAQKLSHHEFFLYLGRHVGLAVALEGALKLKEITYIPTDAYAAGEMKHGPIALLSEGTPVICVATDSPVLDKLTSNLQEVRARGAHAISVITEGNSEVAAQSEEVLEVPHVDWMLQPLLAVVPLQLLAYHIARHRGLNVDQPRNLAKTVTVE